MNWEHLREDEFEQAVETTGGLCVIPLGCLERHGAHSPVGTDCIKAIAIAEEAASMEEVMVFPAGMWLGDVFGVHSVKDPYPIKKAGYIAMNPRTCLDVLEQLCDEIARNGFRKILFLNSHGGNIPMLAFFLRMQEYNRKPYATMVTDVRDKSMKNPTRFYEMVSQNREEYPMLTDEDMEVLKGWAEKGSYGGGHADFSEVASVMGVYPELIATDRLDVDPDMKLGRSDYLKEMGISVVSAWDADHPSTMNGYTPYGVSQTIGQAMNTCAARLLAKKFKVLKEDEECVKIATDPFVRFK